MIGGAYLAYEGVEKIIDYFFHKQPNEEPKEEVEDEINHLEAEKKKVNDAIRTDFILSLEIVIIALSTVLDKPLWLRISTVSVVALIATVGVYGIVALIVRMDDLGFSLIKKSNGSGFIGKLGQFLVKSLPVIIKMLSVIGTIALLLVAGGLFLHNVAFIHHLFENLPEFFGSLVIGLLVGLVVVLLVIVLKKLLTILRPAK